MALVVAGCAGKQAPDERTPPYVLVHGAWMGAWVWDDVADRLRDEGARVEAVELPAHGEDPAPASAATLGSYVDRVVDALDAAGRPAVLVGHSLGGFPISGAAEARPDAVARLVYVAAYLPQDGDVLGALAGEDTGSLVGPNLVYNADGTAGIPADQLGPLFCGDCSADAVAALAAHYRDEPGAIFGEPIALTPEAFGAVPRSYVFTAEDAAVTPSLQRAMVERTPVDREINLETAHTPQLSAPDELAAVLLGPE
jgi:pimeloyl-ACP methyl ester carboxylesterase